MISQEYNGRGFGYCEESRHQALESWRHPNSKKLRKIVKVGIYFYINEQQKLGVGKKQKRFLKSFFIQPENQFFAQVSEQSFAKNHLETKHNGSTMFSLGRILVSPSI